MTKMFAKLLRFRDLKDRGIAENRVQLKRLQDDHGFPLGRMLSEGRRTWTEEEVLAWYQSRPVKNPAPLKGAVKRNVERLADAT